MLSDRLQGIANLIDSATVLADVGCDHGYLPIDLVSRGLVSRAIACDINPGPLERGREHILEVHLEDRIETRLSDGLAEIEPGEVDVVSIAGMGGSLIINIISASDAVVRACEYLVVQPQSNIDEVRSYLYNHSYSIIDEDCILEDGKFYFPIKARPLEKTSPSRYIYLDNETIPNLAGEDLDYAILHFGECLIHSKNEVLIEYLHYRLEGNMRILSKLNGVHTDRVSQLAYENHIIEILLVYMEGEYEGI